MVVNFSSMEFLFRFLPVFLILYFIVPRKYRELTLLVGSFVFYALGDLKFLPVLALLILLNYALASASWKQQEGYSIQEWQQQKRKRYLTMAVFLDAGALLLFKCLGVFVSETLLPLGISFYIFKMISFQADIYKKEIFSKPKLKYVALYFSLFPQVISGPIMRYGEGEFELDRTCGPEELEKGLFYFVSGLGMKVLLEDGSEFGTLKNVMETGANDVYIVDSVEHGEVLLPAIKECILDVDIETNTMTVHLMKGLL